VNLLNFVGMGTVMGTKDTNTDVIMVHCKGLFPTADGRLVANAQTVEQTSQNARGEDYTSKNLHTNFFPATWRNMESGARLTSPDVREGSQVAIYQVSGQNGYYWTTQGVNSDTFRCETIVYGWSANPNLTENTPFNVDNYYTMKIDTRTGLMALRTAQSNSEKSAFDIQVNGMDGIVSIGGSQGNYFVVNDDEHSFTFQNADGSVININKQVFALYVKDKASIFADNQINIKTKELNIQAETCNVDIGLTRWKGEIQQTGNKEQVGDYTLQGAINHTGDTTHVGDTNQTGSQTSSGTITSQSDVIAIAISLLMHPHGGVQGGDGVSGPPV
jgi:hypothetical protein